MYFLNEVIIRSSFWFATAMIDRNNKLKLWLLCSYLLGIVIFALFTFLLYCNQPASGIAIGKDVIICKFPKDPTVALGSISVISLIISAIIGVTSVFYSYEGKSVPSGVLFESTSLVVFFIIAM